MNWFGLACLSAIFFTVTGLLQKAILKRKETDPVVLAILFQFLAAFILLFILIIRGFSWPAFDLVLILRVVIMTVLYSFGAFYWFKAVKIKTISEIVIISSTRPFWVLLGSALFLGEPLGFNKLLGIGLLSLGVLVVYWDKGLLASFGRGQVYALIATTLFAAGFLNDFSLLSQFSLLDYLFLTYLLPGIGLVLLEPKALFNIGNFLNNKKCVILTVLLAISSLFGMGSIYAAYRVGGEASKIVPINQSSVVLTVIFAAIFLKEREKLLKKLIGSFLMLLGVGFLH